MIMVRQHRNTISMQQALDEAPGPGESQAASSTAAWPFVCCAASRKRAHYLILPQTKSYLTQVAATCKGSCLLPSLEGDTPIFNPIASKKGRRICVRVSIVQGRSSRELELILSAAAASAQAAAAHFHSQAKGSQKTRRALQWRRYSVYTAREPACRARGGATAVGRSWQSPRQAAAASSSSSSSSRPGVAAAYIHSNPPLAGIEARHGAPPAHAALPEHPQLCAVPRGRVSELQAVERHQRWRAAGRAHAGAARAPAQCERRPTRGRV